MIQYREKGQPKRKTR